MIRTYEHELQRNRATATRTFRLLPLLVGVLLALVIATAVVIPAVQALRTNASVLVDN